MHVMFARLYVYHILPNFRLMLYFENSAVSVVMSWSSWVNVLLVIA